MKLKRLRAAIAEQVEGHIGQPEKKRQQRAERKSVSTLPLLSMVLFTQSNDPEKKVPSWFEI